jgi:hypothetical protein
VWDERKYAELEAKIPRAFYTQLSKVSASVGGAARDLHKAQGVHHAQFAINGSDFVGVVKFARLWWRRFRKLDE